MRLYLCNMLEMHMFQMCFVLSCRDQIYCYTNTPHHVVLSRVIMKNLTSNM